MATTTWTANVTQSSSNSKPLIEANYRNSSSTEKCAPGEIAQTSGVSEYTPVNGKPRRKDEGKRLHMYVNLPTQLAVNRRNPNYPENSKPKLHDHKENTDAPSTIRDPTSDPVVKAVQRTETQVADATSNDSGNESTIDRNEKNNEFCWSPRCPPDGAAFYEISPPPSSVSSSPVSKSAPYTKLLDIDCDNLQSNPMVVAPASIDAPLPPVSSCITSPPLPTADTQHELQAPSPLQPTHGFTQSDNTHVTWSTNAPSCLSSFTAPAVLSNTSLDSLKFDDTVGNHNNSTAPMQCSVPPSSKHYTNPVTTETNRLENDLVRPSVSNSSGVGETAMNGSSHQQVLPSQSPHLLTVPTISKSNVDNHLPSTTPLNPFDNLVDGRTVVPWNVGTRDLQSDGDRAVQEAVLAAFAHSSSVSTDIPQWIPPHMTTSRQRLMSCPVENSPVEVGRNEYRAKRPTCLANTSLHQMSAEQVLKAINGSVTRADRSTRRHHTTSNFTMLPSSPCAQSPVTDQQNFFHDLDRDHAALRGKEYQPLSPVEAEWWRAQQRSKLTSTASSSTAGYMEKFTEGTHFRRQISAGPTFNVPASTGNTNGRKLSTKSCSRSGEILSSKHSPITHQSLLQQVYGDKLVTEEELLFAQGVRSPIIPNSPEKNLSFDPQFVFMDPSVPSLQHSQSVRNQVIPSDLHASSMTQSVFFPYSDSWVASKHSTPTDKSVSSASTRQRRAKSGISRTQSHRSVHPPMQDRQWMDEYGPSEPPSIFDSYHRSVSQTVPATQMFNSDTAWPQVMAHWHHRHHVPSAVSNNDLHELKLQQSESRRVRRSKTGRSSHDLSQFEGMRLTQSNHHHHSTSTISERLENQTWFHPNVSRAEAERLLHPMREGSFLVRQSDSKQSGYSLSIRRESDVLHMKITQDMASGHFVLGEYSQPYPSIAAMIHRYRRSLLPVRGTTPILLRYAVENRCCTNSGRPA